MQARVVLGALLVVEEDGVGLVHVLCAARRPMPGSVLAIRVQKRDQAVVVLLDRLAPRLARQAKQLVVARALPEADLADEEHRRLAQPLALARGEVAHQRMGELAVGEAEHQQPAGEVLAPVGEARPIAHRLLVEGEQLRGDHCGTGLVHRQPSATCLAVSAGLLYW